MSQPKRIRKVLVANRGEIAVRVLRTCQEMGLATVAVYSDADRGALHVRKADEAVHLGPSPARESYLSLERLLDAAKKTGADAVHPGYGFLSERPELARAVEAAGLTFVGPGAAAMEAMGGKTSARAHMRAAGVPVVPGSDGPLAGEADALVEARILGFPVMVKAVAGGGGRGLRRCDREADLPAAWQSARREALAAFGDDRLYLEKALDRPRHVEVQLVCDEHGGAIHLGERECSVQRRHQKVIEESPSPLVDEPLRGALCEAALRAARAVGYRGAGTVEFLVDQDRRFYFLEMNARLQVEHPVTELVTGLDLVRLQLEVAAGLPLPPQASVSWRGHAVEARVCAEDPARGFLPSPGKITYLRVPGGPGIRDDGGVYGGFVVTPHYDPLLSKLSAWAPTREQAVARLVRALGDYVVHGITTNVAWLASALSHPAFQRGDYDTTFCTAHAAELLRRPDPALEEVALIAAAVAAYRRDQEEAQAGAARAGAAAATSAWLRQGRAQGLRGWPR
ncbi:MAG: acetyl-CoA carboxylase biotin carboxylase subunit [Anaeromyxobacter sp.]|nr:acetyl-CoA carboxylase biotin carboxylase subunit [Anaeromyxobacter sp.]MBL0275343.1 acetyl-CoA carboxylase biotin carboxylase subunit [Anaeromyxobacter sp.]